MRQVLPALAAGKTVKHAWLGIETGSASASGSGGAQVSTVVAGGPADDAGLQPGDIITSIDGRPINDPTELSTIINGKAPGDTLSLTVQRGGGEQTIDAQLRERPARTP